MHNTSHFSLRVMVKCTEAHNQTLNSLDSQCMFFGYQMHLLSFGAAENVSVKCIKHEVLQEVANKQEGSTGSVFLLLTRFSTRSTQPCCTIYQSKFMNQLSSLLLTSNWDLPQTAWQMGRKAIRAPCWSCFPELLSFSWLIMTKCSLHLENLTQ